MMARGRRSGFMAAPTGRGAGSMARSRRVMDRGTLAGVVIGLAVLAVVVGQIALANGIIRQRTALSDLRADRTYLQARIGLLELDWNRQTSREAIAPRAAAIGLVRPEKPSVLLVLDDAGADGGGSFLQRALAVVGAAEARASDREAVR